ncbi:hypothetical protein EFK50_15265 [Nocardioides marmoriginsengisoli]|uniref:Uncharacterized protein n=1 Tax=Nocardioides marmoriginsengisoli TaxID=661483 RepID=A0A3N0CIH3_9ACTN|nr:hypothetical protein [Nocardioides marmoriginsengisoli]RNL63071.1 hypothetical protein EFK50_15265 [Nocardioides marmoriginsengisoli]
MRIYVPTTLPGLAAYLRADAVPSTAERFVPDDETEEAEYEALSEAAEAATALLDEPGRRVVVVADVPDEDAAFPISLIEAVHADTDDVDPASDDLPDLGWYATQEIDDLIG